MDLVVYKLFIAEVAVFLVIAFAALFRQGRYFVPLLMGLLIRLLLIYIHEITRLFGDVDLDDYLPFFNSFVWHYGEHGEISKVIGLDATAYTLMYPGWIYYWFGWDGLWVIRVVGTLFSIFAFWPLADLHQRIFKRPMSIGVAVVIMLWPTWLRYSVEAGRSAVAVLSVLVPMKYLIDYAEERRGRYLLAGLLWTVPAFVIRVESVAFVAPALAYLVIRRFNRIHFYLKIVLFPFVVAIILGAVYGSTYIFQTYLGIGIVDPAWLKLFIEMRAGGESDYLVGVYPGSALGLVWYLPLHAFYFLFSPMPWDANKPFVIGSAIQAWIIFVLLVQSLRNNWLIYRKNRMLQLLMITLAFVVVAYGSVTKNAGGAERWRLPISLALLTVLPMLTKRYVKTPYHDIRLQPGSAFGDAGQAGMEPSTGS